VRNHASTFTLSRIVKHGELVAADMPDAAFDLLRAGDVHAFAAPREALLDYSVKLPGSRVLTDAYGVNVVGLAVRKGQGGRLAYVSEFIEEAKASGLIQRAIEGAGLRGVRVAAPVKRE
jgi:polar amino acid transport system substrate-binding protein